MWIIQIKSWKSKSYHNTIIFKARAAHILLSKAMNINEITNLAGSNIEIKNNDLNNKIIYFQEHQYHPPTAHIPHPKKKYCYLFSSFKIPITAPLCPFIFYLLYYLEFRLMQKAKPVSSLYLLLWVLRAD